MKNNRLFGQREYVTHPEPMTGLELDPQRSWISVIVPERTETINQVFNPSFEKDTAGWAAVTGSILRSATQQRHGVYGLKVTPTGGAAKLYYGGLAAAREQLTAGEWYTFSIDLLGTAGSLYRIYFADTGGNMVSGQKDIRGHGFWERISVSYQETALANRRLYIEQVSGGSGDFYLDGAQLENLPYPTTYFDGDALPLAKTTQKYYHWMRFPHQSWSRRLANTPGGGREVNLLDVGFRATAIVGLGMPPFNSISTQNPLGGAYYQRSIPQTREFGIAGSLFGESYADVMASRRELMELFNPVTVAQPITMRIHILSPCGESDSEIGNIPCVYESGLEMSVADPTNERIGIIFKSYEPNIISDDQYGVALGTREEIVNPYGILEKVSGVWQLMDDMFNDANFVEMEEALTVGLDGYLYFAARWDIGATVEARFYKYDPETKTLLDTLVTDASAGNNWIYSIHQVSPTLIYIGGIFPTIDGVANTLNIAAYNPVTGVVTPVSTGINGQVYSITGDENKIYIGGGFSNHFDANGDRITSWDGSAWASLGTGLDGTCWGVVKGPDDNIYAVGAFSQQAMMWDVEAAAWVDIGGTEFTGTLTSPVFDRAGNLYVNSSASNNVHKWNGVSWEQVGSFPLDPSGELAVDNNGYLYTGVSLYSAPPKDNPLFFWNKSEWVAEELHAPFPTGYMTVVDAVAFSGDTIYIATRANPANANEVYTSAHNVLTNQGIARATPLFTFSRSGGTMVIPRVIKNYSTGAAIYMNYALTDGESITVDCQNGQVISNFHGEISSRVIVPGSDFPGFYLLPGYNDVAILVAETGAPTIEAYATWRNTYSGIDHLVRRP